MPQDVVSGLVHISLTPDVVQYLKRIEITFSGRSEIECLHESRRPWSGNGRTILFDELQILYIDGDAQSPLPGFSQWSFSFIFPSQSCPSQHSRIWPTSTTLPTLPSEPGLPLPPSVEIYKNDWKSTGEEVYGMLGGRASIIYELEARLVDAQGNYIAHAAYAIPFESPTSISLTEPTFIPKTHIIRCESRQLISNASKFSHRARARSLLQKVPRVVFKLITELPNFSISGQVLPIYLGVDFDFESSIVADLLSVLLRSVKVLLIEQFQLGYRQTAYSTDWDSTIRSISKRLPILLLFHPDEMVQITERVRLPPVAKLVVENLLSFQTPNIRRSYRDFQLIVTIVCAGKEFSIVSHQDEMSFIPPMASPKDIELSDSRLLPSELQSEAVCEIESGARINELQGAPFPELDGIVRSS